MNIHSLSFSAWPFPGPQDDFDNCKLCMSKFGMVAYSTNNAITIFAEELDRYTPMLMWKPFGSSSTSQNSRITAIGWYDASCCFEVSLPVIVIASGGGSLIVFDIRSTKVIASFKRKSDYVTTIKWSPYSNSTFFAGTSTGSFVRFEVNLTQFVTSTVKWEIKFSDMQIDFIAIDEIDGNRAAISSKKGNFGVVYNINTDKPFHSADSLLLCDQSKQITNCSFFPIHRNFLIVATNCESMLYALEEGVTVHLLNIPDIQHIQISQSLGNRAIVVRSGTIELWELQKDMSKRISSTKISSSKINSINEIQLVDMLDDTIVLLTSTFWLTTIELRRNKLFVTKRVKLFNSRPNDFSFANEALAFCTEDGKVLITRTSSPKFKMLMRWNNPKSASSITHQTNNTNEESGSTQQNQSETSEPEEKPIENTDQIEPEKAESKNKVEIQQTPQTEEDDHHSGRQKIRRHMTLGSFPLKKQGGFNFLDDDTESSDLNEDKSNNNEEEKTTTEESQTKNKPENPKKAAGKRKTRSRRYTVSDFELTPKSTNNLLNFMNQKTFDPLPEDDEIVTKSLVIRRGSLQTQPSFLDEANEDGSFTNVTTQLIDGHGSFEQPSSGLVIGNNSAPSSPERKAADTNQLPHKIPSNSEYSYNSEADNRTVSSLKKPNSNLKANEKHVKIPIPISMPPEKKRRLSSSMEEVNLSSNLLQIAKKTKLNPLKDSSFSFEPSVDTINPIPPISYQKRADSINSSKSTANNKANSTADQKNKDSKSSVKEQIRTVKTQNHYGNNCSFLWSYQVSNPEFNSDKKRLNRIEWITGTRLIAWNQDSEVLIRSTSDSNLDNCAQTSSTPNQANSTTNQTNHTQSLTSLKSRQGVVYVIDLKLHKVLPLLKKPGMCITDVIISKSKQLFAVIVNGFIVSIFISSNKQGPYLLGSITFRNEVVVTFLNEMAVMINTKTKIMTVTAPIDVRKPSFINGGNRKLKIKHSYGSIKTANGSSKGIFIGTSLGYILKVEAVTYNVMEIVQMNSSITRFRWTSSSSKDTSFLAIDQSGAVLMLNDDGEFVHIRGKFSNAIPISPVLIAGTPLPGNNNSTSSPSSPTKNNAENDTESTSKSDDEDDTDSNKNEHYFIEAVSTISSAFKPKFPTVAARNPLMKPRSKWAQILSKDEPTVKDLPMYGIPLIAKLIEAERNPNYSSQQTLLLRDLIMNTPQLWHRAFRYSLLVKDNETAKNILVSVPNNHPEFMKCLLKRALFGSSKSSVFFYSNSNSNSSLNLNFLNSNSNDSEDNISESIESVQAAAKLMNQNGFVKDAVDILLIAGLWVNACKLLIKRKLIINAISIARICAEKNNNSEEQLFRPSGSLYVTKQDNESNMVIKELADIVLAKNLMPSYAATILCEAGFIDDVISILQDAGESEQARMLSITE